MACNENIVKNMANEITRNCHTHGVVVEPEFVAYMIHLLLLNPKYGKLFSKTLNRNNLEYFVNECVSMLTGDETSINTLKMQFTIQTSYDKLPNLIDKHLDSIETTLRPLVVEILDADPEPGDEAEYHKLFRKISIYINLASGLGNPSVITTLKEGMAALESVFSLQDLRVFVALPRGERSDQLQELLAIVSGVRLFNRDCRKGGEGIPDLPFNLVDAGKACLTQLSNSLIAVMQRVNALTTAIEDTITVQEETGNIVVNVRPESGLTLANYQHVFDLLAFNRQYEVYIRRLLCDVETMLHNANLYVERVRAALEDLHRAVKYKAAVPVATVFPLFSRLWHVWRSMQNVMYLVSTVSRLMAALAALQDRMPVPREVVDTMLAGKTVLSDQERMSNVIGIEDRLCMAALRNYVHSDSSTAVSKAHEHCHLVEYLGFCALCLCVGALVPADTRIGLIRHGGHRYGFCNVKMATRFSKDTQRYVNEVLDYARNNPHVINLLNVWENVHNVRDVDNLVVRVVPKTKVFDKDIQTEAHPIEEYMEKNYHWDLWEWKRRACQWATIVNCRTKSTQTIYSHLRSEIHCQTVEPRDKTQQTKRECGVNTGGNNYFVWGLRAQLGAGQHMLDLDLPHSPEKLKPRQFTACTWPCIKDAPAPAASIPEDEVEQKAVFYDGPST
ncbi:cilia- and flagella-associated protein 206 [Choristoneura fumiferana]|uniref:cilia- and flagella-associated protein 206 n=1 Tax=Choristoneura fumiferana TaxID=7141 RepID=UPI003D15E02C